jgi:hypothetical protein
VHRETQFQHERDSDKNHRYDSYVESLATFLRHYHGDYNGENSINDQELPETDTRLEEPPLSRLRPRQCSRIEKIVMLCGVLVRMY